MVDTVSDAAIQAAKQRKEQRLKNQNAAQHFNEGELSDKPVETTAVSPAVSPVGASVGTKRSRAAKEVSVVAVVPSTALATAPAAAAAAPAPLGPSVDKPMFLLTDDMVKAVVNMNLKTLKLVATALNIDCNDPDDASKEKSGPLLKSDIIRYTGSSDPPTFDLANDTFEFPNLSAQDFRQPVAPASA